MSAATATADEIADLDEQIEIAAGRRAPFTMVPDWITFAPKALLSVQAKALYVVLAAHVNVVRGDGMVWPTRRALAKALGYSRPQSIDDYIAQLIAIGALEKENVRVSGGMRERILYRVHQTPPNDYPGPVSLQDFYIAERAALQAAGKRKRPAKKPAAPHGDAVQRTPGDAAQSIPGDAAQRTAGDAAQGIPQGAPDRTETRRTSTRRTGTTTTAGVEPAAAANAPGNGADERPREESAPKPPRRKKEKSPEEAALDEQAHRGAVWWWGTKDTPGRADELAQGGKLVPYVGDRQRGFLAVQTMIRAALKTPYTSTVVAQALESTGRAFPGKREFEDALARIAGIRVPQRAGSGRPAAFNSEATWGTRPTQAPSRQLTDDDFGFVDDHA